MTATWPVFSALFLLGAVACVAFLIALAYVVSAYANSVAGNKPAFWREARRGLLAFAVPLACTAGIVAIGVAVDAPALPVS